MAELPSGTVTFLFTDVEGSTRLWEEDAEMMRVALIRHDEIVESTTERRGGHVVRPRGEGDSRFCVFAEPADAVEVAAAIQLALAAEEWPTTRPIRVRMALHTGAADLRSGDYYGSAVNRCARLRALAYGGQTLVSRATRSSAAASVAPPIEWHDLGEHRLKDLAEREHVYQLLHPGLAADFPPLASLDARPNNLPRSLTTFVGRESELTTVRGLLERGRMVTLTGAGGSGKTRLALETATGLLHAYPDGVWLVELAPLADPDLVPQAVLEAIGAHETAGRSPSESLTEHLAGKTVLIALDNCEHLLAACARLANDLLANCPRLAILATSQERLGVPGEAAWRVPPLRSPEAGRPIAPEELAQYEAVRLFVDRALLVQPDFAITGGNAAAVARVCRRLDGIPLAIELAAARLRVLPVVQIAIRLDDRFRLLTGGSRVALPRHQTLRALVDWSHELLAVPERMMLRRLAVFAGGWTLEAAERVCADWGPLPGRSVTELAADHVLDLLGALVDKSLVVVESQGEKARFRLLETIREYAWERLREADEEDAMRAHHLAWSLELAERAAAELGGRDQKSWLERLDADHDNLRSALAWCGEGEVEAETALRLAAALAAFWHGRGHLNEGRAQLERVIATSAGQARTARAWALLWLGFFTISQRERPAGLALMEESLADFRALGDQRGAVIALRRLGDFSRGQDRRMRLQESLGVARATGDRRLIGVALSALGNALLRENDYNGARPPLEESLALLNAEGDRWEASAVLGQLGLLAARQGDYERAERIESESLAIKRELGIKRGIAFSLAVLSLVARLRGDAESARVRLAESAALFLEAGETGELWWPLEQFGHLALAGGDGALAVRMYAAAGALHTRFESVPSAGADVELEAGLRAARGRLGDAAFEAAWANGLVTPLEAAVGLVLGEADAAPL